MDDSKFVQTLFNEKSGVTRRVQVSALTGHVNQLDSKMKLLSVIQ